ncbi:MAG: 30S ribosomal protein S1 [Armatimonadetes bacterium]|nr:30S ribosomal protein S1 [Armatimonadota bacterium]
MTEPAAVPMDDSGATPVETPAVEANGAAQGAAAPPPAPPAPAGPGQPVNQSDFESMFKELSEGDVVVGTVVHIDKDGVLVDVGAKSEGIIRPNELSREPYDSIEDVVKVGESVKVVVIGRDSEDGSLLLSKKRADFEKAWDRIAEALNEGTILHAMVTERVKGGLVVDLGVRGFVPASHVGTGDFKHQNLDKYVGQSVPLKVIEVDRERRKVVLSNKLATQEERENRKTETLASLKEGDVRRGIIRRVTDYGAFVDLGGIDGLLHVSEMSWSRIKHPSEVVRNGQELDVMILKLRLDQGRISLGLRQILPDPWTEIGDKYKVGDTVKAAVSRLVPFGAFVALDEGVEAIIPNSELSERRVARPGDVVNPGDEVEARVIEIRPDERKMTLSIRRLVESTAPREPYVPETEGGGRGRGGRDRDRDREGGRDFGAAAPPREGPPREGPPRERRRREGGGGGGRSRGGDYNTESEEDYREYRNFRASQREETFGTSLADVLGAQLNNLRGVTEETTEEAAPEQPEKSEEETN